MAETINFQNVSNPVSLVKILNAIDTELDASRTLVAELETDHATFKTLTSANKVLANALRAICVTECLVTSPGLSDHASNPNVTTLAFDYTIDGAQYHKATANTALSGDNLPTAKTGAWRLEIGADGTIDIIPAADNSTGYASAATALAAIPAVSADHIAVGTVVVANTSGSPFDPGTTNVDAANIATTYADGATLAETMAAAAAAVSASDVATLSASSVSEQIISGD